MKETAFWLSVLIPVYNVENYLRHCLDSVLTQADSGVEILLVDDASTDGSAELMRSFAIHAPQVRCLFHHNNQGLSAARNTLLNAAAGRYVWFLDADDYLMSHAITRLRHIVEQHAPDLVMCDFRRCRADMPRQYSLRNLRHAYADRHVRGFCGPARQLLSDASMMLQGVFESENMFTWIRVAKRSVWGNDLRFPRGRNYEDISTTPALSLRAANYWYEPKVWVSYRIRPGSITNAPSVHKCEHLLQAVVDDVLISLRTAETHTLLSKQARFACAYFSVIAFCSAVHTAESMGVRALLLTRYQEAFKRALPCSLRTLKTEYLRRGRLQHLLRLYYWLYNAKI